MFDGFGQRFAPVSGSYELLYCDKAGCGCTYKGECPRHGGGLPVRLPGETEKAFAKRLEAAKARETLRP